MGEEVEIVGLEATQELSLPAWRCSASCSTKAARATISARCCAAPSARKSSAARCWRSQQHHATHKFKAEAYILTKEEGGRHAVLRNYRHPSSYFRTTDVTGVVTLPEGTEMVMPGDNVTMDVELIAPIAMDPQLRFAIREGGRRGRRRRRRHHGLGD